MIILFSETKAHINYMLFFPILKQLAILKFFKTIAKTRIEENKLVSSYKMVNELRGITILDRSRVRKITTPYKQEYQTFQRTSQFHAFSDIYSE